MNRNLLGFINHLPLNLMRDYGILKKIFQINE
jgi:hypothetical protein